MLIGTDGGGFSIVNVRDMQWQTYTHQNAGISNNKIWGVESDSQGNIWLGHYMGGASMLSKQIRNFHTIIGSDTSRYLSFPLVTAILKDKNNFLWIANDENGLLKTKGNKLIKEYRNELNANFEYGFDAVISLFEDSEGTLWIGTYKGGVSYLKNGKFHNLKHDTSNIASIPTNDIRAIAEDRNGDIWIATHGQGVCKLKRDRTGADLFLKTQLQENFHLNSDWCWDMEVGSDNILWICTSWGLEAFDIDNNKMLNKEIERDLNGYEFTWMNSVDCLEDGNVAITCRSGAYIYNPALRHVKKVTFPVLGFDPVSAVEDKNIIWFAGLKGIAKYNRDDTTCFFFNSQDGLQGDQFMKKSSFMDSDGYVYFGGTNGISYFHPDEININYLPPKVLFTQLQLINKEVSIDSEKSPLHTNINFQDKVRFTHDQNIFRICFAAQNYIQSERNEYKYKLKGFDETWQICNFSPEAVYMNLEPGDYTLLVQASNNDKVWNRKGAELKIKILPPWWNTIWFRTLMLISIVLTLLGIYNYRVQSIKQYNKKLEQKVAERTHEISMLAEELKAQNDQLQDKKEELTQINYTKDKFFSIIAHDLKNPMGVIIGFADLLNKSFDKYTEDKKKKFIETIANSSKNLLALLENLLEWSRSQSGRMPFEPKLININEVINENITTLKHHAKKKDISLNYHSENNTVAYADYNMINTVLRNLTSNAIKFTPHGGQINYSISELNNSIKISIQDSGIGMNEDQLQALFRIDKNNSTKGTDSEAGTGLGLILCKEFIDKHNGEIWAESTKGEGSTFNIVLPISHL